MLNINKNILINEQPRSKQTRYQFSANDIFSKQATKIINQHCGIKWILLFILVFLAAFIRAQDRFLLQKVSLQADSIKIDKALDILANNCKCYFTYNAEIIKGDRLVSINIVNLSLNDALDTILNVPDLFYAEFKNQVVISNKPVHENQSMVFTDSADIIITGRVVDKQTKKVLPFASVAINGTFLGTICNESGLFSLKIPYLLQADTILISHIGYYTTKVPLVDSLNHYNIELLQGIVSIQEVVVRKTSPELIISKALERVEKNYEQKHYNYTAFYREGLKKESKYIMYTEALLFGYKPKSHNVVKTDKVEVMRSRKLTSSNSSDTVAVKLSSGLASCLSLDIIDETPLFLCDERNDMYKYALVDIVVLDESLAYCVSFTQQQHISESLPEGLLYISINDYAFVGCDFKFVEEKIRSKSSDFVVRKSRKLKVRPKSSNYYVRYKKNNGKYYLNHVRGELEINVKKKRMLFSKDYGILVEMAVTDIDKFGVKEKFEKEKQVKINSIFSDSQFIYEKNIWAGDNIIIPEDDIIKAFEKTSLKVLELDKF